MNGRAATLEDAVRLHQSGRLADAERAYRSILSVDPRHADALHLLGVIALQRGELDAAIGLIGTALESAPGRPPFLCNLATAHLEKGDTSAAVALYRQALAGDPHYPDAAYNLGNALRQRGDLSGAAEQYRAVVALFPGHLAARSDLGLCLAEAGNYDEAIAVLDQTLAADPAVRESHANLALALHRAGRFADSLARYDTALRHWPHDPALLNGRGLACAELDRPDEAEAAYREALAADPADTDALLNLGNLRRRQGRPDEAEDVYRRALALAPDSAAVLGNLALLCADAGRHDEALSTIDRALALRPDHADSLSNRGWVLKAAGRIEEAIAAYDRALSRAPTHREARLGRAISALLLGRFGAGWRDYLGRDTVRDGGRDFRRDLLPAELNGRHVVIERDQGLGDEIFFFRFAGALRARGARTTYLADPRIAAMLGRSAIVDRALPIGDDPGPADIRLAVGDLPYVLGMGDGDSVPPPFALPSQSEREDALRRRLAAFGPPPYLAVTWRAGTRGMRGAVFKEAPPNFMAGAIRGAPGTIVAIQRLPDDGEVAALAARLGRPVMDLTALNDDLEDMLALMGLLDDYICVSNTNVHLRAARGLPCRVLVPNPPEFRWMAAGAESPWFPGTRVYRQAPDGDWSQAVAALTRDLAAAGQG